MGNSSSKNNKYTRTHNKKFKFPTRHRSTTITHYSTNDSITNNNNNDINSDLSEIYRDEFTYKLWDSNEIINACNDDDDIILNIVLTNVPLTTPVTTSKNKSKSINNNYRINPTPNDDLINDIMQEIYKQHFNNKIMLTDPDNNINNNDNTPDCLDTLVMNIVRNNSKLSTLPRLPEVGEFKRNNNNNNSNNIDNDFKIDINDDEIYTLSPKTPMTDNSITTTNHISPTHRSTVTNIGDLNTSDDEMEYKIQLSLPPNMLSSSDTLSNNDIIPLTPLSMPHNYRNNSIYVSSPGRDRSNALLHSTNTSDNNLSHSTLLKTDKKQHKKNKNKQCFYKNQNKLYSNIDEYKVNYKIRRSKSTKSISHINNNNNNNHNHSNKRTTTHLSEIHNFDGIVLNNTHKKSSISNLFNYKPRLSNKPFSDPVLIRYHDVRSNNNNNNNNNENSVCDRNGIVGVYISIDMVMHAYQFWQDNVLRLNKTKLKELCAIFYANLIDSISNNSVLKKRLNGDINRNGLILLDMIGWLLRTLIRENINAFKTLMNLGLSNIFVYIYTYIMCVYFNIKTGYLHASFGITATLYEKFLICTHNTLCDVFDDKYTITIKYSFDKILILCISIMTGKKLDELSFQKRLNKITNLTFLSSLMDCLSDNIGREYLYTFLNTLYVKEIPYFLNLYHEFVNTKSNKLKYSIANKMYNQCIKHNSKYQINLSYNTFKKISDNFINIKSQFKLNKNNINMSNDLFKRAYNEIIPLITHNHWTPFCREMNILKNMSNIGVK